jgi:hypothetical protein
VSGVRHVRVVMSYILSVLRMHLESTQQSVNAVLFICRRVCVYV